MGEADPAPGQPEARSSVQRRVARVLLLEHELARIARAFAAADIDLVVLKGAPLARQLFDGPAGRAREQRDNDLLVRVNDLARALGVLEQLGYCLPPSYRHRHPLAARTPEWQLPLLCRKDATGPMLAELHWTPFPPRLFPVSLAALWDHTIGYSLRDGASVRVLDQPLTLVHLASHYVQHAAVERWILEDFAAGWNRWSPALGPEAVRAQAEPFGLRDVLDYTLLHAGALGLLRAHAPERSSGKARLLARVVPHTGEVLGDNAYRARSTALALLAHPSRIPGALAAETWPPLTTMTRLHDMAISPRLLSRYASRPLRPLLRMLRAAPSPHDRLRVSKR